MKSLSLRLQLQSSLPGGSGDASRFPGSVSGWDGVERRGAGASAEMRVEAAFRSVT